MHNTKRRCWWYTIADFSMSVLSLYRCVTLTINSHNLSFRPHWHLIILSGLASNALFRLIQKLSISPGFSGHCKYVFRFSKARRVLDIFRDGMSSSSRMATIRSLPSSKQRIVAYSSSRSHQLLSTKCWVNTRIIFLLDWMPLTIFSWMLVPGLKSLWCNSNL